MTYRVVFSPAASREMHRIPPRIIPAIIEFVYGDLAASPRKVGKPLARELAGSYGARRGSYRILYDVTDGDLNDGDVTGADLNDGDVTDAVGRIVILRVEHRADVYRPRG